MPIDYKNYYNQQKKYYLKNQRIGGAARARVRFADPPNNIIIRENNDNDNDAADLNNNIRENNDNDNDAANNN